VTLARTTETSTTTKIVFPETNGSYGYSIGDVAGWRHTTIRYSGTVTVQGSDMSVGPLTFSEVVSSVTFQEAGLPNGTARSVTVAGTSVCPHNSSITTSAPNGTETFDVGIVDGYSARPVSCTVNISGKSHTNSIRLTAVWTPTPSPGGSSTGPFGLPGSEGSYLVFDVVAGVAIAAAVVALRRLKGRPRTDPENGPNG
jgi:hypothetical protein